MSVRKLLTKTGDRSATEDFLIVQGNIEELISRLQAARKNHAVEQKKQPGHYGFVSDSMRVQRYLALALAALGDSRGANELGLEW